MPNEPEILYVAAMLAQQAGHPDAATKHLEHLLEINPNHVQANNALGYLYTEENIRLKEARRLLERAYSAAPLDPFILDSMGWLCYREGKFKAAYEFTQASLKRLYDPEVALHLIEILAAADRKKEAESALRDFVKRNGVTPSLVRVAQRLKLDLKDFQEGKDAPASKYPAFMRSPEEAFK